MLLGSNGRSWLAAAVVLSLSWSCSAYAAGDAKLGQKKFYTCYGCHGIENYRNAYPDYSVPKLRHQHAAYIIAALQEYKAGERPHPTMHAQASSLSDQDMEDIAAYLQGPEPIKPSPATVGTFACAGAKLRRVPWRQRIGRRRSADAEAADTGRPARGLPRPGAARLSQRPTQESDHDGHGAIIDDRRGRQSGGRIFREPTVAARDRDDRQQVTAIAGTRRPARLGPGQRTLFRNWSNAL